MDMERKEADKMCIRDRLWVVQKFRFRSLQKEVWNRATDEIREKEGKH